jgi:hypothetical protein
VLFLCCAAASATEGEYLITDHGARGDNAFDNAPLINSLIAGFGPEGGTILIPAGDFRIQSPLVVKGRVTIRGVNYGQRSNVDATPLGVFFPAGGSKLILGGGVTSGILLPPAGAPVEGLAIRDLAICGSDVGVDQTGIRIERENGFTRISGVNCVNLKKGVYLRDAVCGTVERCWLAECESSLHLENGSDCVVADNSLGGQPGGVTCELHGQARAVFTGNIVFPDGHSGLRLTNSHACNVTHNTFTAWYAGAIIIEGNMNLFAQNTLSAVLRNGSWPADPLGRDGFHGFVRVSGNDNVIESCTLYSWQPEGDCRFHCAAGDRNVFRNLDIGALGSGRKIFSNGGLTNWTRITRSGVQAEIDLGGSPTARATYDP